VSSDDGLDEMSTAGRTQVVEVTGQQVAHYGVDPGEVGLDVSDPDALAGGSPDENADTVRAIFAGDPGPQRDVAVLNAGAAIYACGRADSLEAGVRAAEAAVDDGAAAAALERFVARTVELAPA
jgi:anthranilate phosphoribosyltransferase